MTEQLADDVLKHLPPADARPPVDPSISKFVLTAAPPAAEPSANAGRIAKMRDDVELRRATATYHRDLAELQRDQAWLDVLSPREEWRERFAVRRLRGMRRRDLVATEVAAARLTSRERRAEREIARADLSDQVWQRRALARRRRLIDPTSRLASLQRTHVAISTVLLAIAIAGIAWTATGVHDALVGTDGPMLAYVVEPLFALPLLVIMALQARAAQWGRTFPAPEHRHKVMALEAGLLLATITINTSPVLPVLGTWKNTTTLLAHLAPPVLIVVAVVLQPMAASFLAGILEAAHVDVADAAGSRLAADTVDTLTLVAKVRAAIAAGEIELWADTGLPSVEAVRRFFGCEKRRAQGVHDALKLLQDNTGVAEVTR